MLLYFSHIPVVIKEAKNGKEKKINLYNYVNVHPYIITMKSESGQRVYHFFPIYSHGYDILAIVSHNIIYAN